MSDDSLLSNGVVIGDRRSSRLGTTKAAAGSAEAFVKIDRE